VQPAGENGAASAHGSTPQGEGQLHAPSTSRRLSLGLFNAVQSDVHAIATGEIAHDGTIVVSQLAVHPSETHREESTSALRMMCGLRSLASTIETNLDIEPLRAINKGRYWLAGIALLSSAVAMRRIEAGDATDGGSIVDELGDHAEALSPYEAVEDTDEDDIEGLDQWGT